MGSEVPGGPGRDGFGPLIGVEELESGESHARARIAVDQRHLQPHGLVHGGVFSALAEELCSQATDRAVRDDGNVAIGQSTHATFLRPISEGHVIAEARLRHRGRTTWVWEVEISDDGGRLCALVQIVIAIRPRPKQPS